MTRHGRVREQRLSAEAVSIVVKRCVAQLGYDPALFGGHSLRAGFLTEAARQGASIFKMREVSRHKSMEVLSDYVRSHELFRDHAGAKFL